MRTAADRRWTVALAAAGTLSLSACGGSSAESTDAGSSTDLPQGSATVELDPADFTVDVTNKYWPMKKGDRWVYEERDEKGVITHDEVTVLDETEKINGIEALVVHDLATQDGVTIEDTTDWYAEDEGFVLSTGERVQVPAGKYADTLMTRDTSPLEPKLVELKFYAPGVGPVMELPISGESGRTVLVETTRTG